jgi:hypothetical protein
MATAVIAVLENCVRQEWASRDRLSTELYQISYSRLKAFIALLLRKLPETSKQIRSTGVSASHGDFRRFLYEAMTKSMPLRKAEAKTG